MAVHTCVNSQTPPLLYRSQQSKFWLPEGSPLAKGCKCWLLEEWKHVVSYVPEIEMGSKGNRTEDQQHLWGGTLLSVNDTYEVVGERLPWRPVVKTSLFNAGLVVLIPGPGAKGFPGSIVLRIHLPMQETQDTGVRSWFGWSPGEGNDYPLQYSCLGNLMDREAWWATVHGVAKTQIWLSNTARMHGELRFHTCLEAKKTRT